MHFNGLDLNLLVALDVLLTERNITLASRRLHLSQSAASGALARLRDYFGDELLTQVGRRMVLTPLGESLAAPVRDILLRVETTVQTRPQFDPASARHHFKLLMSDYVATVLMTRAIPRLQRAAPGVTLEMLPYSDRQWEALERGEVDFLIMPTQYLQADHPAEPLFEDSYTCIAWSGNDRVGESITLEQYLASGHVTVRFGPQRLPAYDEWFFARYGHVRQFEVITTSFNAIPQFVVGTSRIATMHRRLANFYRDFLPLKLVEPPVEMPRLTEAIVWHQYREHDPASLWLREALKQAAAPFAGDDRSVNAPG
ncbi:MAG: LysR family transcriptional regulator [Burkholderiales bacterium]|nr:LysR family transcriptional regulator [Burkholderiales bacterium]OJX04646.1 MAG: nodulation protein NfeD [Burkholderiales bacterium 70-64]